MPEEKAVVNEEKVTEEPVEEALPEGDAPFKSSDATVEDESTEEVSDETSEEADAVVDAIAADTDPEKENKSKKSSDEEAEEIIKKPETDDEKSNVQKRIDRLTAEIKALREENEQIKTKSDDKVKNAPPKYTYEQLAYGLEKAITDNDPALARDVFFQGLKQVKEEVKKELIDMYEGEKKASQSETVKIQKEWAETILTFDRYSNDSATEMWPGSKRDLKLSDPDSLIYKVAMKLYLDPEKGAYYRNHPSGQKLAATDALTHVISYKSGSKVKDSEKERLKRQLLKEKRKKSLGSGSPGAEDRPARSLSDSERLQEVIEERKRYQAEREI